MPRKKEEFVHATETTLKECGKVLAELRDGTSKCIMEKHE